MRSTLLRLMRRIFVPLLVLLALVAAGCGSDSSGGGLETALRYVPKDAPLVVAVDTDPKGKQWKQVEKLLGKFPFGGQVKQQLKARFEASSSVDYDKDVKPLLGNDFVFAITSATGLREGAKTAYLVAWKVKDVDTAERLVKKGETKVGSASGADIYRSADGSGFTAIDGSTIVSAQGEDALKAALKRSDGDHMSESDFENALGDLPNDSLVRVTGDLEAILAGNPGATSARQVKWIAALRTFGYVITAEKDGISTAFDLKTDSDGLTDADLPIAAGDEAPPVVRRAGEIGFGFRDLTHGNDFFTKVLKASDPAGYSRYLGLRARVLKQFGIKDVSELTDQLTGNATVSVALYSQFGLRSDLRDPAAARTTFKKLASGLAKRTHGTLSTVAVGGDRLYKVVASGGTLVLGVVGKSLIAAPNEERAQQIAVQSPSKVAGAKGSIVMVSDARALANAIAQQQGRGTAAQIVTGALGDLVGWVSISTSDLEGKLKLQIK